MSLIFIWQEEYSVGHEIVDQEHRRLFELANVILAIDNPNGQIKLVKDSVKELFEYMKVHFENEESLMREIDFPLLDEHATEHKKIVKDMNEVLRKCKCLDDLVGVLKRCMFEWVIKHIMEDDKKIGEHAMILEVTSSPE